MPEKPGRLAGKVAIVTGAGSSGPGIGSGRAIAVMFAREGASVLLMDQSEKAAAETLELIAVEGGKASIFVGDVTREQHCRAAAAAAVERYGKLEVLVNNVGINRSASILELKEEDWDLVLDVNLKGMVLMAKHAMPKMLDQGGGAIVNLSSIAALRPSGTAFAYAASKGGIEAMSRSIAVTHGRQRIRSNCIAPGNMYTPMVAVNMSEEKRRLRTIANPLGLEGTGWDIAYAAVFLASDEARWITGQTLVVDGGYTTAPIAWFAEDQKAAQAGKH